ncbi:carbohydrate ABC transporter permease [Paenibacillus macquariensis]|uniref:Aldouronate transport system permease protein n=1 Tax=Paenibacillus macquariensis TaxID=948756 RepID=A0ABY1K7Y8_9BACL|nr:carbohydrate ABC transporter permease [Paenibacillus macquariensis]MEC0091174.1 carbohydrate ABC transporter permease [Paenibacillus macquariensis]OAB33644.1 sugar ABC transporter permease [Paenibacillus macquariensis subsp. macquariensis]SIR38604.1 putative aldouronate transport system permease protein [Paenibacillus macquariensis]
MLYRKLHFSKLVIHLMFIAMSLACILPLLLVVSISFTDERSLMLDGYRLWPKEFSLNAYKYVFNGAGSILNAYAVTVFVTVVGTLLHLLFTSMLAYSLTRPEVTHRKALSFFVYLPVLFNGGLVPSYILMTRILHLKDTIWVLIVVGLVSAVNILIMKNFFRTIPESLIESARIDGSGEIHTFFRIVLPLSKPSLATIGLFVSIGYWNDWMTASLYIESQKLRPLQYLLQSLMNNIGYLQSNSQASRSMEAAIGMLPSEGARMATCVLAIGPIILLYPLLQKYFEKGLTIGAVKE